MTRIISLFGEQLTIAFNMAVEIAYEKITGKSFDVEDLNTVEHTAALYYAAIITNNPETKITADDLLRKATAADIITLREAVFGAFADWCAIPDVMKEKDTKEEEGSPNA